MIIVKFSGGLGNQIYQFVFLKKMQMKYPNVKIVGDISFYKTNRIHNGFELEKIFKISEKEFSAGIGELLKVKCEIPVDAIEKFPVALIKPVAWLNARSRKGFTKIGIRNEIKEEVQSETGIFEEQETEKLVRLINNIDIRKNWYIDGYWQNELFFSDVLAEILQKLHFPAFKDEKNMLLEDQIRESAAVSIHIRRGDYVNSRYDVLTLDYYKKAIQYIQDRAKISKYYIFTDDVRYAETEFSFLGNKYVVRHNTGENSWCDMKLMSLCKYNILANSSFSNWAGYFNKNRDKIIIYPSRYSKTKLNTDKFGVGWIKMDIQ